MKIERFFPLLTPILLPLGLFLSTATRLRFPGIPIGVSEILLVIVLFINRSSIIQTLKDWKSYKLFYLFWGCFFLFGFLGLCCFKSNSAINQFILKDSIAYAYVFILSIFFLGNPDKNEQTLKIVMALYVISSLIFIGYDTFFHQELFHPYRRFPCPRFIGLSLNPNQIALALSPLPFLGLHYAFHENTPLKINLHRFLWISLMLGSIYVGAQNTSIALLFGWCLFGFGAILVKIFHTKYQKLLIFTSLIMFASGGIAYLYLKNIWPGVVYEFEVRTYFTSIAFKTLQDTYFLGKGIGTYILQGNEAYDLHNTFLNIFLNSGVITGSIALILLGVTFRKIFKTRNYFIALAFLNVVFFSCAHSLMRHPIFWLYLIACYQIARGKVKKIEK